jgi:hypothetical protein
VAAVTPLHILRATRLLLADEKRWTKRVSARDANGDVADYSGERAVCWCLTGAIFRVGGSEHAAIAAAREAVYDAAKCECALPEFNDSSSHAEVLAALDAAISNLEAA